MPKVKFHRAPRDVADEVAALVADRYPRLSPVSIRALMTTGALKERGVEVAAVVEVTKEKARLGGGPDVWLILDEERWRILGFQVAVAARLRTAILDRLLHSLVVGTDPHGQLLVDAHDRPVVEVRPADWTISGYGEIARRHGEFALEVIEARELRANFGEYLFAMDDVEAIQRPTSDVGAILDAAADRIDAGALGPDVTASVTKAPRRAKSAATRDDDPAPDLILEFPGTVAEAAAEVAAVMPKGRRDAKGEKAVAP